MADGRPYDYDYNVYGSMGKKGTWKPNDQTTLIDPNPLVTERHGRTGHDTDHPYGTESRDMNAAPSRSEARTHRLHRDDD